MVAIYDMLIETLDVVPDPDDPLKDSEVAIVAGRDENVRARLEESGSED